MGTLRLVCLKEFGHDAGGGPGTKCANEAVHLNSPMAPI